jgi:hypothetical protein
MFFGFLRFFWLTWIPTACLALAGELRTAKTRLSSEFAFPSPPLHPAIRWVEAGGGRECRYLATSYGPTSMTPIGGLRGWALAQDWRTLAK